jgi:hypothetical protein
MDTRGSMRSRSSGLVLALALLSLVDCKSKRTDDKPVDAIHQDELLREKERVTRGDDVGSALRAPKVVVDAQQVSINGYRVAPRSDLELGGKGHRVESVFKWAEGLREHWEQIHPGRSFEPAADVSLPADIPFADALGLVAAVASAGYADTLSVHSGDASATINLYSPRPHPRDEDFGPVAQLWSSNGAWDEQLTHASPFAVPNLGDFPWDPSCPPAKPVLLATAASALAPDCAGGCGGFVIGGAAKFHDALAMTSEALRAPTVPHPTISFRFDSDSPCSPVPHPAGRRP